MKELFKIALDKYKHFSTGRVIHSNEYGVISPPTFLSIVLYEDDEGFYLIYSDSNMNEQIDTYHDSLNSAFDQAQFEFNIQPSEWIRISS